jgi:hypothetical protein
MARKPIELTADLVGDTAQPEPVERRNVNFRLPVDILGRLHGASFEWHLDKQDIVAAALDFYLASKGK